MSLASHLINPRSNSEGVAPLSERKSSKKNPNKQNFTELILCSKSQPHDHKTKRTTQQCVSDSPNVQLAYARHIAYNNLLNAAKCVCCECCIIKWSKLNGVVINKLHLHSCSNHLCCNLTLLLIELRLNLLLEHRQHCIQLGR